jgi:hypothetical protein
VNDVLNFQKIKACKIFTKMMLTHTKKKTIKLQKIFDQTFLTFAKIFQQVAAFGTFSHPILIFSILLSSSLANIKKTQNTKTVTSWKQKKEKKKIFSF